jgi:hypothetical protein
MGMLVSQLSSQVLDGIGTHDKKVVSINFVIFIDAKLPDGLMQGYFEYIDTLHQKQIVNFYYVPGDIRCEREEYDKFELFPPLNDKIDMYLNYRDRMENMYDPTDRVYLIPLSLFDIHAGSVVLMIANIDKKHGIYTADSYADHIVGLANANNKVIKEGRKLREDYWIRKQEYRKTHNIFERMWNAVRRVFW